MKEHPILFNTENVRAILDGRKAQTRRVIKSQPPASYHSPIEIVDAMWGFLKPSQGDLPHIITCPYGQAGDRLWVRETWNVGYEYDALSPSGLWNHPQVYYIADDLRGIALIGKTRPSIFMPRWASRITLEITEVRVERLQEISINDCKNEGIKDRVTKVGNDWLSDAIVQFRELWDSLNAKRGYGWEVNPWVWVVLFRRLNA